MHTGGGAAILRAVRHRIARPGPVVPDVAGVFTA